MAWKLIQRFTSSNPSPRYVKAVVDGFRTGTHGGRPFSGRYGDLGAAFAAIILDREARSTTLDADPTHGQLREPSLKLFHILRSFNHGNEKLQYHDFTTTNIIGQFHMHSPTVFNFYDPLYQPEGPVNEAALISPEAELGTGPFVVGFLNTASSIIRGNWADGRITGRWDTSDIDLADEYDVVYELDLLLTGGRLNAHSREVIAARHRAVLAGGSATSDEATLALQAAQELFLFTAEFHATNLLIKRAVPRPALPEIPNGGRPYRAVVYIFLDGGADSFNLMVPTGGCTGGEGTDLWAQWVDQRGDNAIPKESLLPILADTLVQPCSEFGIHSDMTTLQAEYNNGDAAMIANVGSLVQPVSKSTLAKGAPRPPSLYSHNTQRLTAQNVHAQASSSAKGVMGRMLAALSKLQPSGAPAHRVKSYSISGNTKILEGSDAAPDIVSDAGPVRLSRFTSVSDDLEDLTRAESDSIFGETFSQIVNRAVGGAEELQTFLDAPEAAVSSEWAGSGTVAAQLKVVANIIGAQSLTKSERDVFFVRYGGWDTHASIDFPAPASGEYPGKWATVDQGLKPFVAEIKRMGLWENGERERSKELDCSGSPRERSSLACYSPASFRFPTSTRSHYHAWLRVWPLDLCKRRGHRSWVGRCEFRHGRRSQRRADPRAVP